MSAGTPARAEAEQRFARVFAHLGAIRAYAARRGSADPDAIAAETMAIAWRRLASVPRDHPAPWLYATARNLLLAEGRKAAQRAGVAFEPPITHELGAAGLAPEIELALKSLRLRDREALLLIAWEDLSPAQAAEALGINAITFRARLMRARSRFKAALDAAQTAPETRPEMRPL